MINISKQSEKYKNLTKVEKEELIEQLTVEMDKLLLRTIEKAILIEILKGE